MARQELSEFVAWASSLTPSQWQRLVTSMRWHYRNLTRTAAVESVEQRLGYIPLPDHWHEIKLAIMRTRRTERQHVYYMRRRGYETYQQPRTTTEYREKRRSYMREYRRKKREAAELERAHDIV